MARCDRVLRWRRWSAALVALSLLVAPVPAARATVKYGPVQLSGSIDSQTLMRSSSIDEWQFIQNRNTALLRLDYDWLKDGKFIDRIEVPFISRSSLYVLYRGTYDSFWDIAPGGRQKGVTKFDDIVGGPIDGNTIGKTTTTCAVGGANPCPVPGIYTRTPEQARRALEFTNTLREAYIDLKLADAPLSLRLGRQQVIWGESDQFRLMDVINPLDTTWHLQQEEWDKIRIPLWLIKGIWDFGDLGPISNAFAEVVWNPGDFQPGNKVEFLPAPWAIPVPNPVRSGQIQMPSTTQPVLLSPIFNLQGTSYRKGDFNRNVQDASEIGLRFHGVTDALGIQGLEFTANYLYARSRGIGAVAGAPFGLEISKVVVPDTFTPVNAIRQNPQDPNSPIATFAGRPTFPADVSAKFVHPYTNIFGMTGNYFEGNFTNTVFRMEMAYQIDAPFQSAYLKDRPFDVNQSGEPQPQRIPLGYTTRDVWAGMVGFDRPTWIKWLNPRTTWFLTGQFFWSYVAGQAGGLRGSVLSAGELPYFNPVGNPVARNLKNGVGQWDNGQFAGQIERTQNANLINGNADDVRAWEMLATIAATSFYLGGTIVPFGAIAIDPVNRNLLCQLKLDWFITNNLILQFQEKLFSNLGSDTTSIDPWGAGGLNARRDETGIKLTLQF